MAEIRLTDTISGRDIAARLAVLDWSSFNDPTRVTELDVVAPTVTDIHKKCYMLDQADCLGVLSEVADYGSPFNIISIGTKTGFNTNFTQIGTATPPGDFSYPWYWKQPVQNDKSLEAAGTFVPNHLYFKSETASMCFRTPAGGELGGCIGQYGQSGRVYCVAAIGAEQTGFLSGNYQQAYHGYVPQFDGADIVDMTGHLRTYATIGIGYDACAYGETVPTPTRLIVQPVYTEINGYPYIGLAGILCDALGKPTNISTILLPAWFWGDYQSPEDPADTPVYYGLDAQPDRTSGTYSYTMDSVDLPTAVQPFSGISDTSAGLHVYRIGMTEYNSILETLWGTGSLAKALWDKFKNYKFNPVAGILACHRLPSAFMPTVQTGFVQPKASGSALSSLTSAKYLNHETTVTETARTISMPKFFSSYLNWDPHTSVQLFLPFCGWISLPADRCIDTTDQGSGSISVQYRCDIITGNVVAYIRCFNAAGQNTYSTQASGNAALSVPVTGNDSGTGTMIGAVTAAAGLAAGALTGGVGGAALVAGAAGAGLATQTARHTLQQATQYSGNVAALGCLVPYILVTLPIEHTSEEYRKLHAVPSGLGMTVGQLAGTGYTEMSEFHAEIDCTPEEQQEIENLMMGGVIL